MSDAVRPPLALTMGDPAGCGPQISQRAWQALRTFPECTFFVIGAPELYAGMPVRVFKDTDGIAHGFGDALPVLALDAPPVSSGTPSPETAPATIESIRLAVELTRAGKASGLVTNPIHKDLLYKSGFKFPGHTEYLAELCKTGDAPPPRAVMMLTGGGLHVALATVHLPLKQVPETLNTKSLIETGRITHRAMRGQFGIAHPRLAFTGLNPHAGENGSLGREEIDIINPAAAALRSQGIQISDARPADTVFAEALGGAFDAVIAMTHDQGLIPVKTLDLWGGVNVTLGLPIVRTSPDHGTAYDAAAAGTARPDSLIAAIRLAAKLSARAPQNA